MYTRSFVFVHRYFMLSVGEISSELLTLRCLHVEGSESSVAAGAESAAVILLS